MKKPLRIAIFGAESTGKITLCHALAAYSDEPCGAEYVREFWNLRHGKIEADDLSAKRLLR